MSSARRKIFLSHASSDKELARSLVDLMTLGIGIEPEEVFCTSLEGQGIPTGSDFVDHIQSEMLRPKAVMLLLTQQYFSREFCVCELGAAWGRGLKLVPLIVPPLKASELQGILRNRQALPLLIPEGLDQMREDLLRATRKKGKPFARWQSARDDFLRKVNLIGRKDAGAEMRRPQDDLARFAGKWIGRGRQHKGPDGKKDLLPKFEFDFICDTGRLEGEGVHHTITMGAVRLRIVSWHLSFSDHLTFVTHGDIETEDGRQIKDATTFYLHIPSYPRLLRGGWVSFGCRTEQIVTGRLMLWRQGDKVGEREISEHLWFDAK